MIDFRCIVSTPQYRQPPPFPPPPPQSPNPYIDKSLSLPHPHHYKTTPSTIVANTKMHLMSPCVVSFNTIFGNIDVSIIRHRLKHFISCGSLVDTKIFISLSCLLYYEDLNSTENNLCETIKTNRYQKWPFLLSTKTICNLKFFHT